MSSDIQLPHVEKLGKLMLPKCRNLSDFELAIFFYYYLTDSIFEQILKSIFQKNLLELTTKQPLKLQVNNKWI